MKWDTHNKEVKESREERDLHCFYNNSDKADSDVNAIAESDKIMILTVRTFLTREIFL